MAERNEKLACPVTWIFEGSGVPERLCLGRLETIKSFFAMPIKELEADLDNYNVTYITNKTKNEGNIKNKSFNVLAIYIKKPSDKWSIL